MFQTLWLVLFPLVDGTLSDLKNTETFCSRAVYKAAWLSGLPSFQLCTDADYFWHSAFHFEKWQTYSKVARISTLNTHTFHPLACLRMTQPVLHSAHSGTGPLPSFPLFSLSLRVRCISCHPLYAAKHLLWTRTSSYITTGQLSHVQDVSQ